MSRTKAKSLKGDKRYKDAPRYNVIFAYEDDFKKEFENQSRKMMKEIVGTMKEMKP